MMGWLKKLPNSTAFWLALVGIVLVCSMVLPAVGWGWLRSGAGAGGAESNSTTVRNIGFMIAGVLALVFAVWRGVLAQRQAETAQRQSETSQQGLLNERYQKGAEMLGSEVLPARLGGIYALQQLAEDYPAQYHLRITRLLCGFVRLSTSNPMIESDPEASGEQDREPKTLRADVQDAMQAIVARSPAGVALETKGGIKLYLNDAHLSDLQLLDGNLAYARLTNANLSRAVLTGADLSFARLRITNLSGARLRGANLSEADFWGANLCGTILRNANISGADFCGIRSRSSAYRAPARGLTQAQLDEASAYTDNPPYLEGVLDAETGEQLVWRGKLIDADS